MDVLRRDGWKIALTILLPLIGYYCFEIIPWTGIIILYKANLRAQEGEEGDLKGRGGAVMKNRFQSIDRSTSSAAPLS